MGGDQAPDEVNALAVFLKGKFSGLKTAWYSGLEEIPSAITVDNFDFIKIGPYIEELGGLRSVTTNQRLYRVDGSSLSQIAFAPKNG